MNAGGEIRKDDNIGGSEHEGEDAGQELELGREDKALERRERAVLSLEHGLAESVDQTPRLALPEQEELKGLEHDAVPVVERQATLKQVSAKLNFDQSRSRTRTVKKPRRLNRVLKRPAYKQSYSQLRYQKYELPEVDKSKIRYTLIYCDDTLQNVLNVKRELMYCKPENDGRNAYYEVDNNKMGNEFFKQKLRSEKGIYFNFNVSPNSPRKAKSPQAMQKQRLILRESEPTPQLGEQIGAEKKSAAVLDSLDSNYRYTDAVSFTKQDRHKSRESRHVNVEDSEDRDSVSLEIESDSDDDEEMSIRRSRQTSAKQNIKRSSLTRPFERMQPVNCNEIKLFRFQNTNCDSEGKTGRRKSLHGPNEVAWSCSKYERTGVMSLRKQPQDAELGSSMSSVEKKRQMQYLQQENNLQISPKADEQACTFEEAMDVDEYQRLRDLEDYLFENYQSPTMKDIKLALRRREIDEIDERCQSLQMLLKGKQKKDKEKVNVEQEDELEHTVKPQLSLSPNKNAIFSFKNERQKPEKSPNPKSKARKMSQQLEEHNMESTNSEQRRATVNKSRQPCILNTEASLEYNGHEADDDQDGLRLGRERSATIKLKQRPAHLSVNKNQRNPIVLRAKQNQILKKYAVEDYAASPDQKVNEASRNEENPQCAMGEDAHPLFGIVSLIEPKSATFPKFSGQSDRLENQDQAHIHGQTFISRENRQLSNLSGKSQTGSDESQFIEVKGSKSDEDDSEQHSDSNLNTFNTRSRFDAFKDIQDQKKSIFTRKFQTKKLLMLQNKIEYDHHEIQQIGGITQRDIEILTKSKNLRDPADKASCSPSQAFEKSIFIQRAQRGELQEEISIQLIDKQTASYQFGKPQQLNSHQRGVEKGGRPFDFNFETFGQSANIVVVRNGNKGFLNSGAVTSKTTVPLQQPRPTKAAKHSNSNLPASRAGNSNQDLSDERDNTPLGLPNAKRIRNSGSKALEINRRKSNRIASNINKKERKRQMKRLFNSSHANGEEDFIENQKKKLEWLKELSEKIRGVRADQKDQGGNQAQSNSQLVKNEDVHPADRTPLIINYKILDWKSKGNKTPLVKNEKMQDSNQVIKEIHVQVMKRNSAPDKTASQKSIDRRTSNRFSRKVHINHDSRQSGHGVEQLSIYNVFSDKKQSQKIDQKNCPSVQEIEIHIDNSDREDQEPGESMENLSSEIKLINQENQNRGQRSVEKLDQASPKFFESNEVPHGAEAPKEMNKVFLNFGAIRSHQFQSISDATKPPELQPSSLNKTSSRRQVKSLSSHPLKISQHANEEDSLLTTDPAEDRHAFLGDGQFLEPGSSFEQPQFRNENHQVAKKQFLRGHARKSSTKKPHISALNKEQLLQSAQTLQIKHNQSMPSGGARYQSRKMSLSKSFMKNLQQINEELTKKTKQQDQSVEQSADSANNQDDKQPARKLHNVLLKSQQTTPQKKKADPHDKSIPNSCHKAERQTDWNWDDTFEGHYRHEVNSQNHSSNPFRLKIHNANVDPHENEAQLPRLAKAAKIKMSKKRSKSIQHVQVSSSASKDSESIHRRNSLLQQHLTHATETRPPQKHFNADDRGASTSPSRPDNSPARLGLAPFFDRPSNFAALNTHGKLSINQSPLVHRVSLVGSADRHNGSYNASPNGAKNVSLESGHFAGGATQQPALQTLQSRQKRSQNESAQKIKRLQRLMDEGEPFGNFNQSDDQSRMVSWTSEGFQRFSNVKQSRNGWITALQSANNSLAQVRHHPSRKQGCAPPNQIFSERTNQSLQRAKKARNSQFFKPENASPELKLEKCVTDNIRQNISNDLDGLQNIFEKKPRPSASAHKKEKKATRPSDKRPSPPRQPQLGLRKQQTAKTRAPDCLLNQEH